MNALCLHLAQHRWLLILAIGIGQGNLALAELPDTEARKAAGIRKLTSGHLTLYTDLPAQKSVDELPRLFDAAVPQWAAFFGVAEDSLDDWRVEACLIRDRQRFLDYGLLPADLPEFSYGFQKFDRVWVLDQPGAYYRRHLLLHEGTHAVMNRIFGRVGPAWYREGVAEFVATHRYHKGKLKLVHFPTDKKRVEHWGRIRIVNDHVRMGKVRSIPSIVDARAREFLSVDAYAWSWALQSFGHKHPEFRPFFLGLQQAMYTSTQDVTSTFLRDYEKRRFQIDLAWNLFLHHLDYGYDSSQESIVRSPAKRPLGDQPVKVRIQSRQGWQSTGLTLAANKAIQIAANSRFRVVQGEEPWVSEPQGVTLEYYQGRPLGILLAAIVDKHPAAFTKPIVVGRRGEFNSGGGGTLFLRINERADRLSDNEGTIEAFIRERPAKSGAAVGL